VDRQRNDRLGRNGWSTHEHRRQILRTGRSHTNTNGYGNPYRDSIANTDTDSHTYGESNCHIHADTDSHTYGDPDSRDADPYADVHTRRFPGAHCLF
jgi:hypothetical protein